MSTFGCHNCGVNLDDLKDKPYEQWPCSSCALAKDYSKTFNTGYFDTAALDAIEDERQTLQLDGEDSDFVTSGDIPLRPEEIRTLKSIKNAVANHMCAVLSGSLLKLMKIASKRPQLFEVVIKKMQFPYMSYAEIGASMDPVCSKQNVLHYLKQAVKEMPVLADVIKVDQRYSNGYYALRTVADIKRQQESERLLQQNIFGSEASKVHLDINEVNSILRLPFNIKDEILEFNAYTRDEEYLNATAAAAN